MNEPTDIPKFSLFGENTPNFDDSVQPTLALRNWSDLSSEERKTSLQELINKGWMDCDSEILDSISYLNHTYLRLCPGKLLHATPPDRSIHASDFERRDAAAKDFYRIFINESDPLVLRMISKFAQCLINNYDLQRASKSTDIDERNKNIEEAFNRFDRFAYCINHIFEQFAINEILTRNGFVPRQDEMIESNIYTPTLLALSDPKWMSVNQILSSMFEDYREGHFAEVITKAHSAVHSYLQIAVGEPGQNAKGEVGKLFKEAKKRGLISSNRFTEVFLTNIQSYITSERATKSTAKPALSPTSNSDALLMMNMTLVFLQYCMQSSPGARTYAG